MAGESADYLAPEQRARIDIDAQLVASGWSVQNYKHARAECRRLRRAIEDEPASLFDADQLLALDAPIQPGERFYEHEPPTRPSFEEED